MKERIALATYLFKIYKYDANDAGELWNFIIKQAQNKGICKFGDFTIKKW